MDFKNWKLTRRQLIKAGLISGAGMMLPLRFLPPKAFAAPAVMGLSDPALQPKFANPVPDALAPGFIYQPDKKTGEYFVSVAMGQQATGLIDPATGKALKTMVFGYGDPRDGMHTWPGRTFQIKSVSAGGPAETIVNWRNGLKPVDAHLLPVDTTLHWAYSLPGYDTYTIGANGIPIVVHLHGGHTDFQFDGNPEFFYGTEGNNQVVGPQWANVPGGFTTKFRYDNDVPAGNLWYHDHALGITRLNVYAGMAGFYFVRDNYDTGLPVGKRGGNTLGLPAWPYEKAYAIQDRMFRNTGELFYPAYPGDPYYDDFITGEGAILPPDLFPGGGPTALAEFFGDHMVVNGVIWPFENVEPRNYRLHLLNGTDSRFMAIQLFEVPAGAIDFSAAIQQLDFTVIGSDQGLASSPTTLNTLLSEPGSRYDIIVDFGQVTPGNRVIMKNIGGDEPFGGDIPGPMVFGETDRIMAFDVVLPFDKKVDDVSPTGINFGPNVGTPIRTRKVALFEGKDEFGRLQPLLGTAEPATDYADNPINWPNTQPYTDAGLVGQMEGSIAWHSPTTENPAFGTTEEWEIWNVTGDAHPVHLHLVHFEIGDRTEINFDSNANEDGFLLAEFDLQTSLTGSAETQVVITGSIPTTTPSSGVILVVDDNGDERALEYLSYLGDTFNLTTSADFSGTNASAENDVIAPVTPADDGAYLVPQAVVQHNGAVGQGFRIVHPTDPNDAYGAVVPQPAGYVENTPKDMVTALPGQITRIKATFDKTGRYVWHCHILSHEDHEMMRVLQVT
jgi:FtsP/CotA-like multicopper oxidase with cupredoxin domain